MSKAIVFYASKKIFKHWSVADQISQEEIEDYKPVYHAPESQSNPYELMVLLNYEGNPLGTPESQAYIRKHQIGHTSMSIGDLIYYYEEDKLLVAVEDSEFKELPKDLRNTHMEAIRWIHVVAKNEIFGNWYATERILHPEDF